MKAKILTPIILTITLVIPTLAGANAPVLTIDSVEGIYGTLTINYTVVDRSDVDFVTTNWQFSTDGGATWLDIDAVAIGNNDPKPAGSSFITWDTQAGANNLADKYYSSVSFRMFIKGGNIWKTKSPMPTARDDLAAAVVDGKIYAMGGYTPPNLPPGTFTLRGSKEPLGTVEEYDPSTDSWRTVADMPTARCDLAAASVDGKIYAIGGSINIVLDFKTTLTTVEEYDARKDSWRTVEKMSEARDNLASVVVDGKIYAIGGYNGEQSFSTVEEYDPSKDSWRTVADMPSTRYDLADATVNGKIYAIGGRHNGSILDIMEEYTPPRESDIATSDSFAVKNQNKQIERLISEELAKLGRNIPALEEFIQRHPTNSLKARKLIEDILIEEISGKGIGTRFKIADFLPEEDGFVGRITIFENRPNSWAIGEGHILVSNGKSTLPSGSGSVIRFKGNIPGSLVRFNGKVPFKDYSFKGDKVYPLSFLFLENVGFVYLCGKGKVILKDGTEVKMEGMPAEEPPKEPQTIAGPPLTVSYEYAGWSLPFIVALDKGYFEKHGVNISPRQLEGSPTLDISELDIINGHGFYVLKKEGFEPTDLKFTHPFAMKKDGDMVKGLLVKKSAGITTWTDFKHKGIVISSSSDMDLLQKVFESKGLTVFGDNADIPYFRTGGGAVAGFPEDKDADAVYGWATEIRKFQEEKPDAYFLLAKNLECEYIADPYFMGCTYINMESFGANPTAFRKYLKAIDEAIDFIRQDPKEALAVIPKYFDWEPNEAARFGVYHFHKSTEKLDFEALKKSEGKDLKEFFF